MNYFSIANYIRSFLVLACALCVSCSVDNPESQQDKTYEPDWRSIRKHPTPQWLRDGKFGIYTHWGPYAVHAYGENTTWYSYNMYNNEFSEPRNHFEKNFGPLTPDFGYKDLIPMFTAENFDADEWAKLFHKSGARWAGLVAEHHDGFAMWDTKWSEWNAANMGPKRDVVGELEKAIKKQDMKFVTAFHHAANWFFFPVWDKRYDTGNPENSGLYGQFHLEGEQRNQEFLDEWYGKIIEVIDTYGPDFIWFDFALDEIAEGYVKDFLAYYYNYADQNKKEVVVTYKGHDLVPFAGVRDLELGQEPDLTFNEWITDNSVDDRGAWGWANDLTFKTPNRLIDNLVDRVSKNGYLLLNVGPKPDGTIPEGAKEVLLAMGKWLDTNGEAIYETTPWMIPGEGPTNLGEASDIGFNESGVKYTSEDIRFTVKKDNLYAILLAWPGEEVRINTIKETGPVAGTGSISDDPVDDSPVITKEDLILNGKKITTKVDGVEYVLEFVSESEGIVRGGEAGEGMEFEYEQEGKEIWIGLDDRDFEGVYDGRHLEIGEFDDTPTYLGFYKEEIKRITMLGDGKALEWELTPDGLVVQLPDKKPCEHAYVLKIERYHHPQLD